MGTKVTEDLRRKTNGTPVSRDLRTNPETMSEYLLDEDRFYRNPIKNIAAGLGSFFEDQGYFYGSRPEDEVRGDPDDKFGLREGLYDLTGGYDLGGQIRDYAATPFNAAAELVEGTYNILKTPFNFYKGFGTGTGYGLDYLMSGFGAPDLFEDNPMRHTYEDLDPYFKNSFDNIDDFITPARDRLYEDQLDVLMDFDTIQNQYPGITMDQYNAARAKAKEDLIFTDPDLYTLAYERGAKEYTNAMMDQYGIYNPYLPELQGTQAAEGLVDKMDFGALQDAVDYFYDEGPGTFESKLLPYTSKEAQEKVAPIEGIMELVGGFGLPGVGRKILERGAKMGIPRAVTKGIQEALPGTLGTTRGTGGRFTFQNPVRYLPLRQTLNLLDASRGYGSQFFAPIIAAEMMD